MILSAKFLSLPSSLGPLFLLPPYLPLPHSVPSPSPSLPSASLEPFAFQYPQFTHSSSFSFPSTKRQPFTSSVPFLLFDHPAPTILPSPVLLIQYTSCSSNSQVRGIQQEIWAQSSLEWVIGLFAVSVYQLTPNRTEIENSLAHK